MSKVVAIDDLIQVLEKVKLRVKQESSKLLTEEERKVKMAEAMLKGDAKEKILAVHKVLNNTRLEGHQQGQLDILDFLITVFTEDNK